MPTSTIPATKYTPVTKKYVMDLDTYRHLARWAIRFGPWAEEHAMTRMDAMVKFLESLDEADALAHIEAGWNRVASLSDGLPF